MPETTYLFIDGAYCRKVCDEYMQQMFEVPAQIDYSVIGRSASAQRVFYYDCLNDIQKDGEPKLHFDARVQAQQSVFDLIQSLPGFHVRLGSLTGSRRNLRQKQVDVLLAVEALDHAFRKNMQRLCLIAGDLDFAPLVDSLIRLGTYVEIMYQHKSAARGLYSAADIGHPLGLTEVYGWMTQEFQKQHLIPRRFGGGPPPPASPAKAGFAGKCSVQLYMRGDTFCLYAPAWDYGYSVQALQVEFEDIEVLEKYFGLEYAPIKWK